MKKTRLLPILIVALTASVVHAGLAPTYLPASSYYNGRHDKTFDADGETVKIRLEFAVYSGSEAQTMREITGYEGDSTGFVYGYQVFCATSNTAALSYFALTGLDGDAVSSVTDDIGQAESVTMPSSTVLDSQGVAAADQYFDATVTKAVWEFEEGTLIQGEQSWFLFLYSDYDWVAGDIEIQTAVADDDIPVPHAPEPTTLLLLAGGALLSLRRNKR